MAELITYEMYLVHCYKHEELREDCPFCYPPEGTILMGQPGDWDMLNSLNLTSKGKMPRRG